MISVGSLFSGIGGIDLGLQRTGSFETIWFSEVDNYANAILRKHWPNVPNHGDITRIEWGKVERPDMLAGGFPCQDISVAGKGAGIKQGTRSGLWFEYAQAIRILRPKYALIENVPMLANRGLDVVLSDLAKIGYDAQWGCLSAREVGANHKRERLFIFAYIDSKRRNNGDNNREKGQVQEDQKRDLEKTPQVRQELQPEPSSHAYPAYDGCERIQRVFKEAIYEFPEFSWCKNIGSIEDLRDRPDLPKPLIRGADDGVPNRIHRTKCLGNAVVPQVAETLGYWIRDFIEAT